MFFDDPLPMSDKPFHCPIQRTVLSVNGVSLLVLGIIPGPMMAWCLDLIRASLAA